MRWPKPELLEMSGTKVSLDKKHSCSSVGRCEEIPLRLASIRGWAGGESPPARRACPLLHLLLLWRFESPVSLQVLDPPQECLFFRSPPRLPADTGAGPAAHSSSRSRCL